MMNSFKKTLFGVVAFLLTLLLCLAAMEGIVRLKYLDQKNYNIEMWRYSKLLKVQSPDANLGHTHRANQSAKLQGVEIRLNSFGMRGPEPDLSDAKKKKILFLGSSNTLGWGVPEEQTMTSVLQQELGDQVIVMNAGIGNYNALRYVTLFKTRLRSLHPDIVVVHYFIRDAEVLDAGRNNWLLRNSEVAVLLYQLLQGKIAQNKSLDQLAASYRDLYEAGSPGYEAMIAALGELRDLSHEDGFKVILAMTPDIHRMNPYPFGFVHEKMKAIAGQFGWAYVDFYGPLSAVPAEELWAMPGDPHLNAHGHRIMAETLKHALSFD